MRQLDTTIALLKAFGAEEVLQEKIRAASQHLKDGLLNSIKELHPEHVYKMPEEKAAACAKFLSLFWAAEGTSIQQTTTCCSIGFLCAKG